MVTWTYWLPFIVLSVLSFIRPRVGDVAAAGVVGFLVIWIGLRHQVGDDWNNYLAMLESARGVDLITALQFTDPGYALVNWIGANWIGGIYFVNLVCALLAVIPLVVFCSRQANPALALLVALPYLVTVVYMGFTRQSVAVGFGMFAMLAVQRREIWRYLVFVTIAAIFHKTAVCLFVFAPALFAGRWDRDALLRLGGVLCCGAVLTVLVLWSQAASLIQGYIVAAGEATAPVLSGGALHEPLLPNPVSPATTPPLTSAEPLVSAVRPEQGSPPNSEGYYSAGALMRLAQSIVGSGCFLLIAWRMRLPAQTQWLWAIASGVVVCLFALAFWRSTLADRTNIFFVPLQLYAFSTLPSLFKRPISHLLQGAVIICSAAAFWVWLTYGDNAPSWLPYRSVVELWY